MPPNPFTHREMLTEEHQFVGRSREITNILNRLRNGSSVSLVGERRIGKSSLLYHLYRTGNRRLQDERYRFFYLDMHHPQMHTPAYFAATVLHKLGVAFNLHENDQVQKQPMFVLADALEEIKLQKSRKPILLLDEFEEITCHPALFNDDFLEALRSFCNGGLLTIVTASRRTLKAMTDTGDLTSPFWNIFAMQELKEFIVEDRLDEVSDFIHHFWQGELLLTEPEHHFLNRHRSKHPLKLQVVNYWLLENRTLQYTEKRLKQEIRKELLSYFRSSREQWGNASKRNLPKVPSMITATTEWIGKQIENLIPISKLLK